MYNSSVLLAAMLASHDVVPVGLFIFIIIFFGAVMIYTRREQVDDQPAGEGEWETLYHMFHHHAAQRQREFRDAINAAKNTLLHNDMSFGCYVFEMNELGDELHGQKSKLVVLPVNVDKSDFPVGWTMMYIVRTHIELHRGPAGYVLEGFEIIDARAPQQEIASLDAESAVP